MSHKNLSPERLTSFAFMLVLLLAAYLFWRQPLQVPPGLEMDELIEAQIAEQIMNGDWRPFYEAGQGREPFYHLWLAILLSLVGKHTFTLRLASTTVSLLALAASYRFIRSLLSAPVALLSALFGVTTFWITFAARSGLRSTSLPLLAALAGYFIFQALYTADKGRVRVRLITGGAAVGIAFYTYTAARVLPFIFLLFFTYLFLFHRKRLRSRIDGIILGSTVAIMLLLPLLLYLRTNPGVDQFAFLDFNRPLAALQMGDPQPALQTTRQVLGMFTFRGDPLIFDNIPDRPVFGIAVGIFFYLGLLIALLRLRDPSHALLLLWLAISLLPSMLSQPAPNFYRTVMAQVVVPVFPALALVAAARWTARKVARPRLVYPLATVFALFLVVMQLSQTWRDYYVRWPQVEGIRFFWQTSLADTARFLDNNPEVERAAICTVLIDERDAWWRPAWQSMPYLLRRSDDVASFYDCRKSLLWIEETTHYIFPEDLPPSVLPTPFKEMLAPARPLPTALPETAGTAVYLQEMTKQFMTDNNVAWLAPEAGGARMTLPVRFADTLALTGYNYLLDRHSPGGQVRLLMEWEVLAPPSEQFVLFTHVMRDPQTVVAQQDELPVTLQTLQPGDRFWVLHDQLVLPPEDPPEPYLAAIGLYNPETMQRVPLVRRDGTIQGDRLFLTRIEVE